MGWEVKLWICEEMPPTLLGPPYEERGGAYSLLS